LPTVYLFEAGYEVNKDDLTPTRGHMFSFTIAEKSPLWSIQFPHQFVVNILKYPTYKLTYLHLSVIIAL